MAINDRITSIEEHIKESYQELEGIGIDTTGVNKNLENIPKLIDGYWETLPKVTGEGTSITLDNTKEGKMKLKLKGNTSQETTTGKNLFKNLPGTKTVHSITMTNDGETISISGTNSSSTFYPSFVFYADGSVSVLSWYPTATAIDTSKGFFTEGGTQYLFSILKSGTMSGDSATYLIGRETGLTSLGLYNAESVFTNSIASNSERINFIAIGFKPSQQVDITLKMQIEKGNSRTDYERYTNGASPNPDYPQDVHVVTGENTITIANQDSSESQSYPISLGNIELCKIGTYQDYIYKENNKWYKYGAIGKKVLKGGAGESWQVVNTGTPNYIYLTYLANFKPITTGGYSNYYPYGAIGGSDTNQGIFVVTDYVRIRWGTEDTIANFKTWLSSHNVTLYYILTTPTTTEITDTTLISQLEAINYARSYEPQTNISQENNDESSIINATALSE